MCKFSDQINLHLKSKGLFDLELFIPFGFVHAADTITNSHDNEIWHSLNCDI